MSVLRGVQENPSAFFSSRGDNTGKLAQQTALEMEPVVIKGGGYDCLF